MRVLLLALLFPAFTYSQFGSLSGNVFWKYNDYVGNKPDAGADVKVYSLTDTTLKFSAKCDVGGNFKIERIPIGRYMVIVKSENTTQQPSYFSRIFKIYKQKLDTALNTNMATFRTDLQNKIDSIYDDNWQLTLNGSKMKPKDYLKQKSKNDDLIEKLQGELFETMPIQWKFKLPVLSWAHKSFHFSEVEIKESQNETVVVNFGTTYL